MKKLLYVVLILIIAGISYLKWQAFNQPITTLPTPTETPKPTQLASDDQILVTEYFSLSYPKVATSTPVTESPDSLSWSLRFMGAKQVESGRTQTELFDGYAINVTVFPEVIGDDIAFTQATADRQGTEDACGESMVSKLESVQIAGIETVSFSGGCLGEGTNYYFMNKDSLFRVTYMVAGEKDDLKNYEQAVDKILFSLELL